MNAPLGGLWHALWFIHAHPSAPGALAMPGLVRDYGRIEG